MRARGLLGSRQGFTLVELLIAGFLTGGVFLIAGTGMLMFTQGSAELARRTAKGVSLGSFASQFTSLMESAHIAIQFEHLPIPLVESCGGISETSPVVRKKVDSVFQCVDVGDANIAALRNAGVTSIEFFRDSVGILKNGKVLVSSTLVEAMTISPISYPSGVISGEYYATWPLRSASARPLLIMRALNADLNLTLRYCDPYVAAARKDPDCGPAAVAANLIRVNTPFTLSSDQIIGQPFLIYSPKDPNQYVVQLAQGATQYANPSLPTGAAQQWDIDFERMNGTAFDSANYIAPGALVSLDPDNTWMASNAAGWSTSNPGSNIYLFPTEVPSANLVTWPPAARVAINMLSRYDSIYTANVDFRPRVIALPIELTAIYLRDGQLPRGCPKAQSPGGGCPAGTSVPPGCPRTCESFDLMAKSFRGSAGGSADQGVEVLLAQNIYGPVTIARKLGNNAFQVYVEQ